MMLREHSNEAMPGGIRGHFGSELRRCVLMQHHQGQVRVERLVALLQAVGVSISKCQAMRLLIDQQDDTGVHHRGVNAVCIRIGNDDFARFGATGRKSRLNFRSLLRAGHTGYVVNPAALDDMGDHGLTGLEVSPIRCALPPKARCGAQSAPTGSCATRWSSATTPGSLTSARTLYAGSIYRGTPTVRRTTSAAT